MSGALTLSTTFKVVRVPAKHRRNFTLRSLEEGLTICRVKAGIGIHKRECSISGLVTSEPGGLREGRNSQNPEGKIYVDRAAWEAQGPSLEGHSQSDTLERRREPRASLPHPHPSPSLQSPAGAGACCTQQGSLLRNFIQASLLHRKGAREGCKGSCRGKQNVSCPGGYHCHHWAPLAHR